MAVIPVGAVLLDWKAVLEGFAGHDARKADPRNTIHLKGQYQAMPVNGGCLGQGIGDPQNRFATLLKPNQRRR